MTLPGISTRKLFIDHHKYPKDVDKDHFVYKDDNWNIVRSYKDLVSYFKSNPGPFLISLGYMGSADSIKATQYILDFHKMHKKNLPNILVHCVDAELRGDVYRLIAEYRFSLEKNLKSLSLFRD